MGAHQSVAEQDENEGCGTTTPSVLAAATRAALRGKDMPLAARRGCTARVSIATLAPTDPFIGACNAPRARPARAGPLRSRQRARERANNVSARAAIEQCPQQHVQRQGLQHVVVEQSEQAERHAGQHVASMLPTIMPTQREATETASNNSHDGKPVAMTSPAIATIIHRRRCTSYGHQC